MANSIAERVEERRNRIEEQFPVWPRDTVARHFEKAVHTYADRPYLYIHDNEYTYREIWEQALTYAKGFLNLGVKRREHIAVLMDNNEHFPSLMIATSMIGAVLIPINSMLTKNELGYILTQSDSHYLIVQEQIKDKHHGEAVKELFSTPSFKKQSSLKQVISFGPEREEPVDEHFLSWGGFLEGAGTVTTSALSKQRALSLYPDEVAIIMYTSGSTGNPKGVMLTDDMLLRCSYGTVLSRAIENGRVTFAPLPFYHCFAIIEALFAMSFVGGSIVSALGASPLRSLELMERYRANDYLCVPSMLTPVLNHPQVEEFDLSSLFAMWCGAAAAPVSTWQQAVDVLDITEIITGYGQTEVVSSGVTTEIGDPLERVATRVGRPKLNGVSGLPEFNGSSVQYKTVHRDTGEDLPHGEMGELAVRGATVTHGYYKKPEETAQAIDKDGWLKTGDVGKIDENGYIQMLGRSKEMFKVSGELVSPREVEIAISHLSEVKEVQVVGVKDKLTTEAGAAFVELKEGETLRRKDITRWCAERLAKFKVPRHVFFIHSSEWPMTSTGKVQKFRLQELAKERLEHK
ncbi:class I adenylate-forming enzyme family protein [Salimicrobium salexigens]|uniref:Fatty-acyl-CoA synthase n=1 Tax=Salimicrobium salexigens TaxID=908941 RepID=A0ABY1KTV5_9BACI|nr:class I adenylate-forming enzyme family protein [Salimicrobium salexigens]SIS74894.1 fatty-acyl-CoA synthase [Salimicrobium salexigens]